MKRCTVCNVNKTLESYYKLRGSRDVRRHCGGSEKSAKIFRKNTLGGTLCTQ